MDNIKKPNWDKRTKQTSAGAYGPNTIIPPDRLDVGMTAYAKHNSDQVITKITKVENKYDAEGIIINIIPETKGNQKTDLSVGDRVFINHSDIEHLNH